MDYNDECGVIVFDCKSEADSVDQRGILGGISDQRLEGILYRAQGEIALGQTPDKKDGLVLATKTGLLKFFSIEEPSIKAKSLEYKLEEAFLVVGDGVKLRLDGIFSHGKDHSLWKILTILGLAVVVPGLLLIILLRRKKRRQHELPSNEYLRESKEI